MFTHTLISITRGKVSIFVCVCYSSVCGRKPVVMIQSRVMISHHTTLYQMEQCQRQLSGFVTMVTMNLSETLILLDGQTIL